MKYVILIITIIAVIIVGSICNQEFLDKSSSELNNLLEKINVNISEEEYKEIYSNLKEKWNKTKSKWATVTDHQELDDIEKTLISMNGYMEGGKKEEAMVELEKAKFLIEHIPERHKLKLENIF